MQLKDRLVIPLDTADVDKAKAIIGLLCGRAGYFKAGLTLTSALGTGPSIRLVHGVGAKVFVDLKFHDIPEQVERSVEANCLRGADILSLHIAGGRAMLQAAVRARNRASQKTGHRTRLFGITLLTSLGYDDLVDLDIKPELNIYDSAEKKAVEIERIEQLVRRRARLAMECGLDGVVASPLEARAIRRFHDSTEILLMTPSIRPPWSGKGDQVRTADPEYAIKAGSDMLVVGRPVTEQYDKVGSMQDAADLVLEAIRRGLEARGLVDASSS